jgi:hypothetical protein
MANESPFCAFEPSYIAIFSNDKIICCVYWIQFYT